MLLVRGGPVSSDGVTSESFDALRAFNLMRDQLPGSGAPSFLVVLTDRAAVAQEPQFRGAVQQALAPLHGDAAVSSVLTPYDARGAQAAAMVSRDRHSVLAVVTMSGSRDQADKAYAAVRARIASPTLQVAATSGVAVHDAFQHYLASDLKRAETISLPATLVLLLLVFGTVVAALLPLGVGGLAVLGGVGLTLAVAHVMNVSQYAVNVVTLVGLGVGIDYSLFVVSRFREELARGESVEDALATTMATTGRAITVSALTVALGLAAMLFYQGTFLVSMGVGGMFVVGTCLLYALSFLPALLAVLGTRVDRWRLPRRRTRPPEHRGAWHALAMAVMRRPVTVLLPTLALIVVLGLPFLGVKLVNGDVTQLPPAAEARLAAQTLQSDFPGYDQSDIPVVVQFPGGDPLSSAHAAQLQTLRAQIARLPGVLRVTTPLDSAQSRAADAGQDIAVLHALTNDNWQSDAAHDLVRSLRTLSVPGAHTYVTGETAFDIDLVGFIVQRTPWAVGFLVLATYVVLFLALGSVLLPLKAVVMNLLSLSASFGALVWVFQDGHLSNLLAFTAQPLDPSLPVLLFCIVFGLSMDYEVMLLSRMREEWLRRGDNRLAVAEGLERCGRLVTGAAAIMVAVFVAFGLADVVLIKAFGLGMAVAVVVDATIVRALIVPATMRLLGGLNWWAPPRLRALHDRVGLGHGGVAPLAAASLSTSERP